MRDFANKNYQSAANQPAKKSTTPKKAKNSDKGLPIGRWLLALILLIALCAGLYYLWHTKTHRIPKAAATATAPDTQAPVVTAHDTSDSSTTSTPEKNETTPTNTTTTALNTETSKPEAQSKPKPPEKPQFDFYTVLPSRTVATPETAQPEDTRKPKSFMLQVASYQDQNKAQAMKARLLLIGLKPQMITTSNGWYRIDLGPLESVRDADVLRHKLQQNGINGSMVRQINDNTQSN